MSVEGHFMSIVHQESVNSPVNPSIVWIVGATGHCTLCDLKVVEDLYHILLICPAHVITRLSVLWTWSIKLKQLPHLAPIFKLYTEDHDPTQFLLDATVLPKVIRLTQTHRRKIIFHQILYLTRMFCYSIHISCLKALDLIPSKNHT